MNIETGITNSLDALDKVISFISGNNLTIVKDKTKIDANKYYFVFKEYSNILDIIIISNTENKSYSELKIIACKSYDDSKPFGSNDFIKQDGLPIFKDILYGFYIKIENSPNLSCIYNNGNIFISAVETDVHKTTYNFILGYVDTNDSKESIFLSGNSINSSKSSFYIDDGAKHLSTLLYKIVDNDTSYQSKTNNWCFCIVNCKYDDDSYYWKSNKYYSTNSIFQYDGEMYKVKSSHTSTTIDNDISKGYIYKCNNVNPIDYWTPNKKYITGDIFLYKTKLYKALDYHTSTTIDNDLKNNHILEYTPYENIYGNCLTSINYKEGIPTYYSIMSKSPENIGITISNLNCSSLIMPLKFFVLRDPEVLGTYSYIGKSKFFNYVNMYNISSNSEYIDNDNIKYRCMSLYRRRYNDIEGRWYVGIAFRVEGGQ